MDDNSATEVFKKVEDQSRSEAFVIALTDAELLYLKGAEKRLRLLNELIPDEAAEKQVRLLGRIGYQAASAVRLPNGVDW